MPPRSRRSRRGERPSGVPSRACLAGGPPEQRLRPAAAALAKVLEFQRQIGQAKGDALGLSPYDALLDRYDPGLRQCPDRPSICRSSSGLPELIQAARSAQERQPRLQPFEGPFPETRSTGRRAADGAVGFDFTRGRLDVSLHPFCVGSAGEARITTRYDEATLSPRSWQCCTKAGTPSMSRADPRMAASARRGCTRHEPA